MYKLINDFKKIYPFPLDDFQVEAARSLLERKSVLVTAPTGSGKTVIAEFTIFDALDRKLKVLYTTPLKALSNQKFRDLSEQYGASNVGLLTGDVAINPDAKIVVMTTEILRNILYQDVRRLDDVLYVILDECHYMNDRERGTVWEEIIIHSPKHILFVALSATISNAPEMAGWVTSIHNKIDLIDHPIRPVPLEYLYYSNKSLTKLLNADGSPINKLLKYVDRDQQPRLKKGGVNPVSVIEKLHAKNLLPAIYFVFSRKGCDMNLSDCVDAKLSLVSPKERAEIMEIIQKVEKENPSLADTSPITKKLLRGLPEGIAVHHAGLVPVLRFLVENLFQKNLIKVVFATETLAAGINMPARTTVISSLSKRGDFGHEILSANSFTQMTGRAGRRGKDNVGYCVIINDGKEPYSEAVKLVKSPPDPIRSNFTLSYNMVLNLLKNFDMEEIKLILQRSFGQYLSNREIIDLSLNLEKKQKNIQKSFVPCKYKPDLTVDQMPLLEYENIKDKIFQQEKKVRGIQEEYDQRYTQRMRDVLTSTKKGAILIIKVNETSPILGCLISTYRERREWGGNGNFFAIVQTDKGVTRITPSDCLYVYKDFKNVYIPDDVYAEAYSVKVGSWVRSTKLKKIFDKNDQKRYMKNVSMASKYPNLLADEIDKLEELKYELSKHECTECPILKEHLKEHQEFTGITEQINKIKQTIEQRKEMYINDFKKFMNVLFHFGYIEKNEYGEFKPTEKGLITSYIRSDNELAIALLIDTGILDDLKPIEMAGILATLIFEPRKDMPFSMDKLQYKIKMRVKKVISLIEELDYVQYQEGIDKEVRVEPDIVDIVLRWGSGVGWKALLTNSALDDGDAIRAFRRIIDLLHQLKNIPNLSDAMRAKFSTAIDLIDRDLISVNFEEEMLDISEEQSKTEDVLEEFSVVDT